MSTLRAYAIAVRFADKAWHVEGPGVFFGPYMSRRIAVQIAVLHAKSIVRAGGRLSFRIHDEAGKVVGDWSLPMRASADAAASTVA